MVNTVLSWSKLITAAVALCVFLLVAEAASAATLSLTPSTGVYTTGSSFTATVKLNTQGQPINAAEGVLKFNPKELQVLSINQNSSIFNLWTIEPTFSNSAGTVSFGGGSPRGYTGSSGTILSVTFMPKNAGTAAVNFTSGSALAADGQGTNVLSSMKGGSYTIGAQATNPQPEEIVQYVAPANTPSAPSVTSSTHADADSWHTDTTAQLAWTVPSGVTAVRTALSDNPGSVPVVVYEPPITEKTLEELEQGVQYFHLQFKNENGWGRVAHYRLAVDSEKPTSFEIEMLSDESGVNPEPTLKFVVEDAVSDVRRFIVQIDGGEGVEYVDETGSSTYKLPRLEPGRHSVVVEAFDEAGNSIVANYAFDIASFERPEFTEVPAQIASDVVPVLRGATRPNATLTITVTPKSGEVPSGFVGEYTVVASEDGGFTFIPDASFSNGVYEIVAIAIDEYGAQSDPSEVVRLVVTDPGYVQIGSMLVSFFSLLIPLIALVLLFVLAVLFLWNRIRRIGGYVVRETKEAEESVVTSFANLRSILDTHAKTLAASRKTKKLTKAETELINAMRQELQEAERRVRKEVSDVDDIVT